MSAPRRPVAAANWKMNFVRRQAEAFCDSLRRGLDGEPQAEVVIFPSYPLLPAVARGLDGLPVACGGQDLHPETAGAHTGDVSGPQLADVGCSWVLVGHSERRADHGESDELVGRKARAAVEHGLLPLVCLGESRDERRAGRTFEVLKRQLGAALEPGLPSFELAYEPVWAIGTGDTATPEQAQEAHAFLRRELTELAGRRRAATTRILYGGSANPDNAAGLIDRHDVDGFLIGGASLDSEKFLAIIKACGVAA